MLPEDHFVVRPNPNRALKVLLAAAVLAAAGGLVWYGVAKARTTARPTPTPAPAPEPEPAAESPWAELDALQEQFGPQDREDFWLEAEGDGETRSGVPYVWRVYGSRGTMTDPEGVEPPHTFELYSVIVMYQEADGTWSSWGDDPGVDLFVAVGSVQSAADKVQAWAEEN